jgi:hypothetical protein
METTREIALRTYKEATNNGMQDSPMNWHIWKRAFDVAESELKKLRVADVVGRSEQLTCPRCKSTNVLNPDKDNDAQCIECAFIWAG